MKREDLKRLPSYIKPQIPSVCLSLICGWFISLFIFALVSTEYFTSVPEYANNVSIVLFVAVTLVISAAIFFFVRLCGKKALIFALPASFTLYAIYAIANSSQNSNTRAYTALVFIILSLAIVAILLSFIKSERLQLGARDITPTASFVIVSIAFAALSAYFICVLGARTACYCSPCYDMGIFAQMYDNMAETFLPMTTCERGEHLSHFAVHFSPILYLLLPFCYIFNPLDVLVWAQILVVFSGVFPLWLICRKIKLSNLRSTLVCLVFLFYPAMSSGAFYDFHENAFLAPLILWTLYFVHAKKWIPTFIFALATLTVKEDAALYVAFIALFLIFSHKKILHGLGLLIMAICYFFFATYMLMLGGEGIMLGGRYYNIIGRDGSFTDLLRVALLNPALYAAESFTPEKLLYALNMFLPVAFLPFMTKKISRWLLIAPLFVINLITDYQYQFNLTFQYSFGSGALLVYAAAINLADMSDAPFALPAENGSEEGSEHSPMKRFTAAASAAIIALALTSSVFLSAARAPSQFSYVQRYFAEDDALDTVGDVLSRIDRSKSVMATSMYLTHLYDVDELYHSSQATKEIKNLTGSAVIGYKILIPTDVVVLDLRPYISDSEDAELLERSYAAVGYTVVERHNDMIVVMEKN